MVSSIALRALWKHRWQPIWLFLALITWIAPSQAQTCQTPDEIEAPVRSVLETTARRDFDMAARGDTAGLQQTAIPALASNFGGVEAAIKENQSALAGTQVTVRPPFLLTTDGKEAQGRAEFLCGVL